MSAPPASATLGSGRRLVVGDGVTRDAFGTLGLNAASTGLNFLVTLVLSNALGASGYGAYAFAFAWSIVLTVPAVLGLAPLIIRNVARYQVNAEWGLLRGMLRQSHLVVLTSSFVIVGLASLVGAVVLSSRPHLLYPFLVGLALVPVFSLTTMRQAAMQGLGRIVTGRIPETVLAPGAFLVLALVAAGALDDRFSAELAVALQVAAWAGAFLFGFWLLRRTIPREMDRVEAQYDTRAWVASAIPLIWTSLAGALSAQLAIILLGALDRSAEAGVYHAASRIALFVSFFFIAAAYAVLPALAKVHAEKRQDELQELLTRAVRLVFLCSAPIAVAFVAFAPQILALFGADFGAGTTVLRILVAGEIVRIAGGFGWDALMVGGREHDLKRVALGTLALSLLLSLVLIPPLGAEGAAIASSGALAAATMATVVLASRRLSLSTALVPLRPARRK